MSNYNRGWVRAEPKYRGLRNQGSTCYLNSVLQVLFMTREFRDAVQSFCHSGSSHTCYIDAQLKDLFRQLMTSSPTTEYIIRKLGIENVWKQQDAAEYFDKILSLASPEASQVFHGRLIHRTSCSCGVSTDEDNSFWTLNLPINNAHTGVYNVEEGLKRFFSQSKLTGENQVYCDECEAKRDTTTECAVELYPKVLVLLLKRFEFSYYEMDYVKNNCPVDVPLNIDIPKGVSYELYATVDHVGDLRGGHYTATIQSADDGWYDFNDSRVTPKNNFNPIKSQKGYLLFYRKTQMSDSPQEHPNGSSVDQAESDTNQNNADDGYADYDSDDSFHTPPSPLGHWMDSPGGRAGVMSREEASGLEGGDVTEGGEVTGGVEVVGGDPQPTESERVDGERMTTDVEVPTNEKESREPADHSVPQEASGLEGGDVTECGEVTGGVEVIGGDPQPTESERVDGVRMTTDVEVLTNEKESHEPADHSVPQEASGLEGGDVTECGEVTGGVEVVGGDPQPTESERVDGVRMTTDVEVLTNEKESHEPADHSVPQEASGLEGGDVTECGEVTGGVEEASGLEGGDVTECGEVTGGVEVVGGDPQPTESERVDGERMTTDVEVPTNEKESHEPGDHTVPQEASGTAPIVSSPEVVVNEGWGGRRESTDLLEDPGEGEKEGDVIQKTENGNTDDGNADHDSDSEANPTPPSCSGPVDKRPVWAWRGDVKGGGVREKDDVMECGDGIGVDEVKEEDDDMECDEVRAGDEVVAGDPQPMEVEGLDGKGGESMTTDVEVPTNEKEPGDQAVQQEASGTGPMVRGQRGGVNERRRGQREYTLRGTLRPGTVGPPSDPLNQAFGQRCRLHSAVACSSPTARVLLGRRTNGRFLLVNAVAVRHNSTQFPRETYSMDDIPAKEAPYTAGELATAPVLSDPTPVLTESLPHQLLGEALPTAAEVLQLAEPTLVELGLAGHTPVGFIQSLLEFMHMDLGMPWWGAIVAGTVLARLAVFPVIVKGQREAAKLNNVMPEMTKLTSRMTEAKQGGNKFEFSKAYTNLTLFQKKHDVNPLRGFLVPLVQVGPPPQTGPPTDRPPHTDWPPEV
ncbi:unnamed protein product [Gadus morhua 'NCC']